jgi:Cell Wall Hydrolase
MVESPNRRKVLSIVASSLALLLFFIHVQKNNVAFISDVPHLILTKDDVSNLIKVASTEVVPSLKKKDLTAQTRAVIDTVLNRKMTALWGETVSSVANARSQFSAINSSLKGAYGSVEKMPMSKINQEIAREVKSWLIERSSGAKSTVGGGLNYLNPYYSSAKSLRTWGREVIRQAELTGMVFGAGKAIHYHGTSPELTAVRPSEFLIVLSDGALE